ncbi:hypothetical protein V6N12_072176 [Hibiscus sabdariffa]|uniref:Uncharacterized protein n=1 Tax=Hibiscus sabdariffa TaxID=183260 RepID=A0ABR2FMM7_9ROSI
MKNLMREEAETMRICRSKRGWAEKAKIERSANALPSLQKMMKLKRSGKEQSKPSKEWREIEESTTK